MGGLHQHRTIPYRHRRRAHDHGRSRRLSHGLNGVPQYPSGASRSAALLFRDSCHQQELFPVSLHIPSYTSSPRRTPAHDGSALILLSLLLANIRNCSLPSSRIRALDVLLALSEHLTDESKLDRAVPYVVELLRDEAPIVRAAAIRTLMQIVSPLKGVLGHVT